eukprot:7120807-Alexandrium_andersonii.AAC.1
MRSGRCTAISRSQGARMHRPHLAKDCPSSGSLNKIALVACSLSLSLAPPPLGWLRLEPSPDRSAGRRNRKTGKAGHPKAPGSARRTCLATARPRP